MIIGLPTLTAAALANGLNPCGIGMTITFLGYLLVFGSNKDDKNWVKKLGGVYLMAVFGTYLMTGLLFYGLAYYMQRLWLAVVFKYLMAFIMFAAGLIQIKDAFWPDSPIHLRMSTKGYEKINALMMKMSLPVAALVGVLTTLFSTPCMLPLYAGTASVIARSGLNMFMVLFYFFYYNFVFILPMFLVFVLMVTGRGVVDMKEWEHKANRWVRMILGIALLIVSYLIVR